MPARCCDCRLLSTRILMLAKCYSIAGVYEQVWDRIMRIGAATANGTICLANDVDPSEVLGMHVDSESTTSNY